MTRHTWIWSWCVLILSAALAWTAETDYAQPAVLTGTVMARGSSNILYRFRRTASREGDTVRVSREFTYPDGKPAARDGATFVRGHLASSHVDELQIDARGTTRVVADPKNPQKQMLHFAYTTDAGGRAKTKADSESPEGEVLVGDMIPYFIFAHWTELSRGGAVKFRYIAPDRLETVGFKLVREAEVTWRGTSAVRLRMEPTSLIIAQIVDPLFFIVEKGGAHRVLMYDGRTTPKLRHGGAWKDLDAVTVYDWN